MGFTIKDTNGKNLTKSQSKKLKKMYKADCRQNHEGSMACQIDWMRNSQIILHHSGMIAWTNIIVDSLLLASGNDKDLSFTQIWDRSCILFKSELHFNKKDTLLVVNTYWWKVRHLLLKIPEF